MGQYVKGEIPRMEDESDIIRGGIGGIEIEVYRNLKERLLLETKNI